MMQQLTGSAGCDLVSTGTILMMIQVEQLS